MKLPPLWPTLPLVLLGSLVVFQLVFVFIAFSVKDDVVPSYQTEER